MIELAEVIRELRRELHDAIDAGKDEPLRFEAGPIELEATIAVERRGGAGAKLRFWVVEFGGDAKATQSSTQRIKLTLQPRLADSGTAPWVSGQETGRER
jgi:Trypsin-co-occurring domain 2